MPNYEYSCQKCGHEFLENCLIDDRDKPITQECPSCHKTGSIKRGVTAVQLSYAGAKDMYARAGNGCSEHKAHANQRSSDKSLQRW